ncbi:MAG: glycosyltransferase [Leptolyngbya sp. SIO1D8]|nr:glycosyltransferase [Leptolyngbya sp. SIO1D8]
MNGSPTLKLLLVSGVFPPAIGGPSLQTKQIAQGLIAQGVTVQVVTYGDPKRSGVFEGVPVTFVDASPQRHWWGKLWRNLRVFRDLHRIIRQLQPSVIHMQTAAGNLALITGITARWHRIPSLLKYTADLVAQKATLDEFGLRQGWLNQLRKWADQHGKNDFQKWLFQLYQGIWATTPAFQARLQQHYRVPPEKCWLLPNFIDLQPFAENLLKSSKTLSTIFGLPNGLNRHNMPNPPIFHPPTL